MSLNFECKEYVMELRMILVMFFTLFAKEQDKTLLDEEQESFLS